ncbi:MAG TPA: hypothetical protein VHW23_38375 [Kofleriaceae bacterium]|jgi:hypothetical protein|nr:hypothetical protein [Kofleriaceae bacterium]
MRYAIWAAAVGVLAAAGCSKKTQDGLPPANEWQNGSAVAAVPDPDDEIPHFTPPAAMTPKQTDPHAGLDMGGADPHAGLDMGGGGTDVTKLGLAAPDPDRPIDPTHRVAGTITVDAKAKVKVKPGTSVFLIVKRAGPDGAPSGPPLAVDKLTWSGDGMAFELTEEQAMVAGTDLAGDVVVMARYDQDSDALTKQPGDITGQIRVKIPADHVKLMLDTVLP